MVIVACNTASSLAIDYLQKKFSLPIIGVIDPGVQLAISRTKSQSIGVIGTHATIQSNAYGEKLKSIRPKSIFLISLVLCLYRLLKKD